MTGLHKLPPHLVYTLLGTDHLIFYGGGGSCCFFSSRFSFYFLPIENQRFFFHSLRVKIFFSGQSKNKIFFAKQQISSKCILSELYVRVFLEPNIHGYNIHGYIVYMFVLGPRMYVNSKTFFFNFSYLVTIYPVDVLHFT